MGQEQKGRHFDGRLDPGFGADETHSTGRELQSVANGNAAGLLEIWKTPGSGHVWKT
jgi:hypothetical protein